MKSKYTTVLSVLSLFLVPLVFVVLAGFLFTNRSGYIALTVEDGPIEWCTFLCLAVSAVVSGAVAVLLAARNRTARFTCFFAVFALLCMIASGEEISWGQRVFGFKTPHFFRRHNYQNETSFHNLGPKRLSYLSRTIFGSLMCIFGILLPLAACNPRVKRFFRTRGVALPSPALSLSFLIGCMMMLDRPTGQDEELGELFFSLCFLLFVLREYSHRVFGATKA